MLNSQDSFREFKEEKQGVTNELFELEDNGECLIENIPENNNSGRVNIQAESTIANNVNQSAICIRSACKSYGTKTDQVEVLNKLSMTVPKGSIYGVLGSSGCGKTTLLSCILGLRKLDSGEISVLDRPFTSKRCKNLGPRVGYVPQEIALYVDFTIRETLSFFGWIAGLSSKKIEERVKFLVKLLVLPNINQVVKTLSGGQQRRVSLATALLHEPELLILDEPTVGLDSVLRENIWGHFSDITREGRTTVVITTHYIDEAHQAHRIALMRKGKFLADESPTRLLHQYGLDTLEALFFKLSYSQDAKIKTKEVTCGRENQGSTSRLEDNEEIVGKGPDYVFFENKLGTKRSDYLLYRSNHMKALLWKNVLWMIRHVPMMMLSVLVAPFFTVALFINCIGNNPIDIPIAVMSYETKNIMQCEGNLTCNSSDLSCHYFKYIGKHDIQLIPYDSEHEAEESVLKGQTYASVVIRNNYSAALYNRIQDWQGSTLDDMMYANIHVFRDVSNTFVSNYLKQLLYDSFQDFVRDYMISCDLKSSVTNIPIRWETPIYGEKDSRSSEFVVSGLLLVYIGYISTFMTISITMLERNEGVLERILVFGVNRTELITSHLICQFIIMVLQTVLSLVCLFLIFDVTQKGSLFLITILAILGGIWGIFYGLCLSCACDTETTAASLVIGSGFPMLVLSGILWPLEGMHYLFKPVAIFLPFTHAIESMRGIMLKGWGITTQTVYTGFITMTVWTIIFCILSIIILRFKKN